MKKQLLLFLATLLPMMASADANGTCGDNLTWTYVEMTHTLTISGVGGMTDYDSWDHYTPWYSFRRDMAKAIIEDGVTSIGSRAFYQCGGLTSITIPNSITSIGGCAFADCSSLTSITIPDGVTSIESSTFSGCSGLISISIPNSVTSIGDFAFNGCSDLTSVTIPNSVTSIGYNAFESCRGLTSITIPNSVTSIGDYAFQYCSALTSITIPNSVTSIGYSAFYGCRGLTSITIPNSATNIGINAFDGTAWYDNQPDGLVYAGKVAYKYKGTMPDNTKIVLEEGTLGITGYAFYNCSGLTSITIPNSVTSIGYGAFSRCSGLTSITIPNSVTSIGGQTFSTCENLASVSIGSGIKDIGFNAFQGCRNITAIHINDLTSWCMVSFEDHEYGSYSYDSNPFYYGTIEHLYINGEEVTNLVIPYGVTRLNHRAFYNLKSLTSITIPNTVTSIESETFRGCDNIMTVNSEITEPFSCGRSCFSENTLRKGTLYVPAGTKDLYTRFDGWREFLKIEEMGGAPEESVWLTLKDSQGASKLKLKKGVEQELAITPEEGWKLLTVTMDGTDVTTQIGNDGSFTTPAIMQDAVITIVYEQKIPSEVAGARLSKADVKVVDDGVIISNAEPDTRCVVYQPNGLQVASVIVDGGSRKITLQRGQVYILTIGDRTLKFAL